MKIFFLIFITGFIYNTALCSEGEICAGTMQTFWKMNFSDNSLKLKAKYKHSGTKFCEKYLTQSANAEVELLDSQKKTLRKFKYFIPTTIMQDTKLNTKWIGSIHSPQTSIIQLKFADDSQFKKMKYLKISFIDGKVYGPAEF